LKKPTTDSAFIERLLDYLLNDWRWFVFAGVLATLILSRLPLSMIIVIMGIYGVGYLVGTVWEREHPHKTRDS